MAQAAFRPSCVVGYSYSSGLRLAGITYQGTTFSDQFTYAGSGRLTSVRTGPVVRTFSYDNRQRVQRLMVGGQLDLPDAATLLTRVEDGVRASMRTGSRS